MYQNGENERILYRSDKNQAKPPPLAAFILSPTAAVPAAHSPLTVGARLGSCFTMGFQDPKARKFSFTTD